MVSNTQTGKHFNLFLAAVQLQTEDPHHFRAVWTDAQLSPVPNPRCQSQHRVSVLGKRTQVWHRGREFESWDWGSSKARRRDKIKYSFCFFPLLIHSATVQEYMWEVCCGCLCVVSVQISQSGRLPGKIRSYRSIIYPFGYVIRQAARQ